MALYTEIEMIIEIVIETLYIKFLHLEISIEIDLFLKK